MATFDFDALLKQARESGMGTDEIGEALATSLNKMKQEEKRTSAREKYYQACERLFWGSAKNECFDREDVARLAVLVIGGEHPEWDEDGLRFVHQQVLDTLDMVASIYHNDPAEACKNAGKKLHDVLTRGISDIGAAAAKKTDEPVKVTISRDKDIVTRFLTDILG